MGFIKGSKWTFKLRGLLIFAGIVIVGVCILLAILLNQNMLSKPTELAFSPGSDYVYTQTGFMYISGSTVKYTDSTDPGSDYSGALPHSDMKLAGYGRNTHAVYDSNSLCIIGLADAVTCDGSIKSVKCGNGYVACLVEKGNKESIILYNLEGTQIDEISTDDVIVEYDFCHTEKEQLYVIALNTDSDALVSTVTTYDPKVPAMTGIITVQNQLIENAIFTERSIFIIGTSNLIRYDAADNKESYRLVTRGYHLADKYVSGNTVYFLMRSETDNSIRMYQTSQSTVPSEKIVPYQLPEDALGAFVYKENVYAITPDKVYMYQTNGKMKSSEAMEIRAESVYSLGGGVLLAESGNRLYTVNVTGMNSIQQKLKK